MSEEKPSAAKPGAPAASGSPSSPPAAAEKRCIRVVAAEIERDGRFLITQRRPTSTLPLLWEFPSGRVETGESDAEALRREVDWRLGATVEVGRLSMFIKHDYEDYTLDLCVYRCTLLDDHLQKRHVHDHRWVTPLEMDNYEFPPADAQTIQHLLNDRTVTEP